MGAELCHPEASCLYPTSLPLPLGREGGSWKSPLPRRGEQVGIGVSEDLGQNGEGGPGHGLQPPNPEWCCPSLEEQRHPVPYGEAGHRSVPYPPAPGVLGCEWRE